MSGTARLLVLAVCLACTASTCADWASTNTVIQEGEASMVVGPGEAYVSTRPAAGGWTASWPLGNHTASLAGTQIRVCSARTVTFRDHNATSGHSGMSSHLVFCVRLSEPISAFRWDIDAHGRHVTPGSVLAARYSRDGAEWADAYVYLPGQETLDPPPVDVTLDTPTDELYIGWFAEVPEGEIGWWNMGRAGTLTFVPVGGTLAPTAPRAPASAAALQAPRVVPSSFFGTTTHVNSADGVDLLNDLGVPCVRIDLLWFGLEPATGEYRFAPDFWIIESADLGAARGLDQLAVVTQAPEWALADNGTFPNDESAAALEEFMYQLATKYRGKIRYWQAMNEPNMAIWQDRYITFLKAFHAGVKRADPGNQVVLCGFAGEAWRHLDAVYRLGGKDYFDIIASHSYTRPRLPEDGGYLELIARLHEVMVRHGDEKPLWVTEMGWQGVELSMLEYLRSEYPGHRSYAVTEEQQARGLARLYLLSATVPWIERVYFFHLHQEAAYTEVVEQVDYYSGLFSPWREGNVRPKDAYFAMKTVIEVLKEANYTHWLDLGERLRGLAFERGDEATVALWSLDDGVTMTLEDASTVREVTSMVGTPVLVDGGRLPLSGRPIYVKAGVADAERLRDEVTRAEVTGVRRFQLAVAPDAERARPGRPAVSVEIRNAGRSPATPPPIHLRSHSPQWQPAQDTITDDQPLPAGETRSHSIALVGGQGGEGEVACRLVARVLDGDLLTRAENTVRYAIAGPPPPGFSADGDLTEWRDRESIEIGATPEQRELPGWAGPEDCSVQWFCASDREALYLAVEVIDNTHHLDVDIATADAMWRGDGLQIALDVAGDARRVSNVPQYDGENDVEIGLGLAPAGPLAFGWVNPQGETGPLTLAEFAVHRDDGENATRYEIAMPWSLLGLDGAPAGRWMGVNILVNDNDGEARRGWLEWAPGIGYTKDPSRFPKVLMTCRGGR